MDAFITLIPEKNLNFYIPKLHNKTLPNSPNFPLLCAQYLYKK